MATASPVRTILSALGKSDLPAYEREELEAEIESIIFRASLVRIVTEMDDETLEAWRALIERDAEEEEFVAFLKTHMPAAAQIGADTARELADDILAAQHN